MDCVIFYSWQSDLPSALNRDFIEAALEGVAQTLGKNASVRVDAAIDRDSPHGGGIPDIKGTIFNKIEAADILVADVSIINLAIIHQGQPRPTPNPNVLVEVGYAMKAIGPERAILIANIAYGQPDLLPYDLQQKRILTYHLSPDNLDPASEGKKLEAKIVQAVRTIFARSELRKMQTTEEVKKEPVVRRPSLADSAIAAVQGNQPSQAAMIRGFMRTLVGQLDSLIPKRAGTVEWDELLLQSLDRTRDLTCEFARLADAIATARQRNAAVLLYKSLDSVFERYYYLAGATRSDVTIDYDFFKFIGRELMTVFFASLLRANLWDYISFLAAEPIAVKNVAGAGPGDVLFPYASQPLEILDYRMRRLRLHRVSLLADLLAERHTKGELGQCVPLDAYMAADLFLFLRSERKKSWSEWVPWSTLYMEHPPRFLAEAARAQGAQLLLRPLNVENIAALRSLLNQKAAEQMQLFKTAVNFLPLGHLDIQEIGTR